MGISLKLPVTIRQGMEISRTNLTDVTVKSMHQSKFHSIQKTRPGWACFLIPYILD